MRIAPDYQEVLRRFGNVAGPDKGDVVVHLIAGAEYTVPSGSVTVVDLGVVISSSEGLRFVPWSNIASIADAPKKASKK